MAIREFLQWARTAPPLALAEGAGKLARAFIYADLPEPEREDARRALTLLLDHSSPVVRRALAATFASATNVPHYMVITLANDISDVAAIVLARSPLLSNAELVDCVATADTFAQSAIALRPSISAPVAAALAEVGAFEALMSLAVNPGAELLEFSIRRMIERYGHEEKLRAALLARPNLPASLRSDLAGAAAMALCAMMTGRARLPPEKAQRLTREARERANIDIAADTASESSEMLKFVAHLRSSGQLTAGLLLRALLCGNKHLLETALSELTGLGMPRVMGLVAESKSAGFTALYRKAGMPERLLPAFVAGLEAVAKSPCSGPMNSRLQEPIISSVLRACDRVNNGELDQLIAALRRLEAEAARDEAREFHRAMEPARLTGPGFARARRLLPATKPRTPPARPFGLSERERRAITEAIAINRGRARGGLRLANLSPAHCLASASVTIAAHETGEFGILQECFCVNDFARGDHRQRFVECWFQDFNVLVLAPAARTGLVARRIFRDEKCEFLGKASGAHISFEKAAGISHGEPGFFLGFFDDPALWVFTFKPPGANLESTTRERLGS